MSNDVPSAATAVAEAVARRKLADEQATRYGELTRRGGELTDAIRAVRFHAPDTLPEYAHLCDMTPGKLAGHVERWVDKLLVAGRRIAAEQLQDSLEGDGGTHNPFLPVALALYRAATEDDHQRVARGLRDVCGLLLDRDHGPEWFQFKDALGAVAERVSVAWNVRRDGLLREHCPDIPRPYIGTQEGQGEAEPAPPTTSTLHIGTQQDEGEKPVANASNDAPIGTAKPPIRRAEAERLVNAAIANTPLDQRDKLTARTLKRATGVSLGMLPRLVAWQKLQDEKTGSVRSVPLSDAIRAVLNDPSTDASDPAEAAADAEVLEELLAISPTDADRQRLVGMTPGERWQLLEQIKEQTANSRRDQRRPRREDSDCS